MDILWAFKHFHVFRPSELQVLRLPVVFIVATSLSRYKSLALILVLCNDTNLFCCIVVACRGPGFWCIADDIWGNIAILDEEKLLLGQRRIKMRKIGL